MKKSAKPTKEESLWMAAIARLPCSVNNNNCSPGVQVHHITKCGRRLGHLFTIPLCFNHHHNQSPLAYGNSVHKGTKSFEVKYGTQFEMLEKTKEKILVGSDYD